MRSALLYPGSISTSSADFGEAVTAVSQLSIDLGQTSTPLASLASAVRFNRLLGLYQSGFGTRSHDERGTFTGDANLPRLELALPRLNFCCDLRCFTNPAVRMGLEENQHEQSRPLVTTQQRICCTAVC